MTLLNRQGRSVDAAEHAQKLLVPPVTLAGQGNHNLGAAGSGTPVIAPVSGVTKVAPPWGQWGSLVANNFAYTVPWVGFYRITFNSVLVANGSTGSFWQLYFTYQSDGAQTVPVMRFDDWVATSDNPRHSLSGSAIVYQDQPNEYITARVQFTAAGTLSPHYITSPWMQIEYLG